jgi:hypothetical protein
MLAFTGTSLYTYEVMKSVFANKSILEENYAC